MDDTTISTERRQCEPILLRKAHDKFMHYRHRIRNNISCINPNFELSIVIGAIAVLMYISNFIDLGIILKFVGYAVLIVVIICAVGIFMYYVIYIQYFDTEEQANKGGATGVIEPAAKFAHSTQTSKVDLIVDKLKHQLSIHDLSIGEEQLSDALCLKENNHEFDFEWIVFHSGRKSKKLIRQCRPGLRIRNDINAFNLLCSYDKTLDGFPSVVFWEYTYISGEHEQLLESEIETNQIIPTSQYYNMSAIPSKPSNHCDEEYSVRSAADSQKNMSSASNRTSQSTLIELESSISNEQKSVSLRLVEPLRCNACATSPTTLIKLNPKSMHGAFKTHNIVVKRGSEFSFNVSYENIAYKGFELLDALYFAEIPE
ncbi:hypothetical protein GJ496_008387 [Pomphorhynchus laevis]|nr:hypothetical protein GJ496_008387 [Pomphorhynchus laevis]